MKKVAAAVCVFFLGGISFLNAEDIPNGKKTNGFIYCDSGFVPVNGQCQTPPEIPGGEWRGQNLTCQTGYIKLIEVNGDQGCLQLPEIQNGHWGPSSSVLCDAGYVRSKISCVPREEAKEKTDLIQPYEKFPLCPDGYIFNSYSCTNTGGGKKKIVVRDFSLQGLKFNMSRKEATELLMAAGYAPMTRDHFSKTEADGTQKFIDISFSSVEEAPEEFKKLYQASYVQNFPDSVRFDTDETLKSVLERFGGPDAFNNQIPGQWNATYIDDGSENTRGPSLGVFVNKNTMTMHWSDLTIFQDNQKRWQEIVDKKKQDAENSKSKAKVEF